MKPQRGAPNVMGSKAHQVSAPAAGSGERALEIPEGHIDSSSPDSSGEGSDDAEPKRRDRWYTTGEMARLSNNTLRTVRFYEEAGILRPMGRTEGGHRLFERTELDRLMLVSDMREAGLSLEEIRNVLDTKHLAGDGPEAARLAIAALEKYMEELRRKVDVLTRLHDDLAESVDVAARCLDCTHQDVFPSRCEICDTLTDGKPLPRAMRVLWALSNPSSKNLPASATGSIPPPASATTQTLLNAANAEATPPEPDGAPSHEPKATQVKSHLKSGVRAAPRIKRGV